MKHISVLVPEGDLVLSSVVGAFKIFNKVNEYIVSSGQASAPPFQIDLVGLSKQSHLYNGLFSIQPSKLINEVEKTDVIIVTTIIGDIPSQLEANAEIIEWIRKQRVQHNAEVASLCTGAFLLAATGLLNGKTATTHWMAHDAFRMMFPKVILVPEKIITEENGIYCSGGAYSFLNLLLYLVEKYSGRETAIWCSKIFEIEFDRMNQNEFIIFSGQKDHSDELVKEAQLFIENNFEEKLTIEELAGKYATSRRNFVRRFKKATSNTPLEYIQRVKIEAAKKRLENTTKNINEIMYEVGYNDDKAFRKVFKKHTGITPIEYRQRYNPEMVAA